MFGIPESEIAKSLREMEEAGVALAEVEITTCLRRGEIEIDVRYRDEAAATAEAVRAGLAERHRAQLFSEDGETIDSQVAKLLGGHRLGLAESCSGGLLAARMTDVPGASAYMAGSVVSYANEAKTELLGVDPALIERHGAVSPEVAEAMAKGALVRFDADVAVSITGIAGPGGGTEEKPVGYVCFNARLADGTAIAREPVIPGHRADIRERSALIDAKGAVSPEVAEAMAIGALERFSADVAVSITGIAGPYGGTEEKPVGYVCFNARLADGTAIAREPVIPGGREDIRERSALVGMHLLRTLLSGAESPL
jgi:PncC family amidohydrolase